MRQTVAKYLLTVGALRNLLRQASAGALSPGDEPLPHDSRPAVGRAAASAITPPTNAPDVAGQSTHSHPSRAHGITRSVGAFRHSACRVVNERRIQPGAASWREDRSNSVSPRSLAAAWRYRWPSVRSCSRAARLSSNRTMRRSFCGGRVRTEAGDDGRGVVQHGLRRVDESSGCG